MAFLKYWGLSFGVLFNFLFLAPVHADDAADCATVGFKITNVDQGGTVAPVGFGESLQMNWDASPFTNELGVDSVCEGAGGGLTNQNYLKLKRVKITSSAEEIANPRSTIIPWAREAVGTQKCTLHIKRPDNTFLKCSAYVELKSQCESFPGSEANYLCSQKINPLPVKYEGHWPQDVWRKSMKLDLGGRNGQGDSSNLTDCGSGEAPSGKEVLFNQSFELCVKDGNGKKIIKEFRVNSIDRNPPKIKKTGGFKVSCSNPSICSVTFQDLGGISSEELLTLTNEQKSGYVPSDPEHVPSGMASLSIPGVQTYVDSIQVNGQTFASGAFNLNNIGIGDLVGISNNKSITLIFNLKSGKKWNDMGGINALKPVVTDYAGNMLDSETFDFARESINININQPFTTLSCRSNGKDYPGGVSDFKEGWSRHSVRCTKILNALTSDWTRTGPTFSSTLGTVLGSGAQSWGTSKTKIFTQPQNQLDSTLTTSSYTDTCKSSASSCTPGDTQITAQATDKFTVRIDTKKPKFLGGRIKARGSGGSINVSGAGTPTKFEANETFTIDLNLDKSWELPLKANAAPLDWELSNIKIKRGTNVVLETPFINLSSGTINFSPSSQAISFNDPDIFQKVGTYQVRIRIQDYARNEITRTFGIKILPSDLDADKTREASTFTPKNGTGAKVLASADDYYDISIKPQDRFGNLIVSGVARSPVGILTLPDFDLSLASTDLQAVFEKGLTAHQNGLNFRLYSAVPTIELLLAENLAPSQVHPNPRIFGALMRLKARDGGIKLGSYAILPDGSADTSNPRVLDFGKMFEFYPWVVPHLEVAMQGGSPEPIYFGERFKLTVNMKDGIASRDTNPIAPNQSLPLELTVLMRAYANRDVEVHKFDGETSNNKAEFNTAGNLRTLGPITPSGSPLVSQTELFPVMLRADSSVSAGSVGFSSKVQYIFDKFGKTSLITLPGGSLNNDLNPQNGGSPWHVFEDQKVTVSPADYFAFDGNGLGVEFIEADIEGLVIGENYITTMENINDPSNVSTLKDLGNISARDLREKIEKKAYQISRSLTPETNFDRTDFDFRSGSKVLLFENETAKIGGTISGIGTIVIQDGNLLIRDDLKYADNQSSLGVILINSKVEKQPTTGNIFVMPTVQRMVGTYYADGSLLSVRDDTIDDSSITDFDQLSERKASLEKQLLIEGTLFTKNTFGLSGGIGPDGVTSYGTPWEVFSGVLTAEQEKLAQRYDLHYLRRFKPGDSTNCVTNSNNGTNCDKNKHATVVRPDGRVKTMPPPGFTVGGR